MGNIPRPTYTKRAPRRNLSRRNQMSYAQLIDASNRLGTSKAVRAPKKSSSRSLKLANLSAEDARILLGK